MAYNYFDQLDSSAKGRYKGSLLLINCDDCPYKLPGGVWGNNPCTVGKQPTLKSSDL